MGRTRQLPLRRPPSIDQVEPDPAEMTARYGVETPVPDWRERLVCSKCGSRQVDMVVVARRLVRADPGDETGLRPAHLSHAIAVHEPRKR
jgi:hypothetical protein